MQIAIFYVVMFARTNRCQFLEESGATLPEDQGGSFKILVHIYQNS